MAPVSTIGIAYESVAMSKLLAAPTQWLEVSCHSKTIHYCADDNGRLPVLMSFASSGSLLIEDQNAPPINTRALNNVLDANSVPLHPGQTITLPDLVDKFYIRLTSGASYGVGQTANSFGVHRDIDVNVIGLLQASVTNGALMFAMGDILISGAPPMRATSMIIPALSQGLDVRFSWQITGGTMGGIASGGTLRSPAEIIGKKAASQFSRATLCMSWLYTAATDKVAADQLPLMLRMPATDWDNGAFTGSLQAPFGAMVQNTYVAMDFNAGAPDRVGGSTTPFIFLRTLISGTMTLYWLLDYGVPDWGLESCVVEVPAVSLAANEAAQLWYPAGLANGQSKAIWLLEQSAATGANVSIQGQCFSIAQNIGLRMFVGGDAGLPADTAANLVVAAGPTAYQRVLSPGVESVTTSPTGTITITRASIHYFRG